MNKKRAKTGFHRFMGTLQVSGSLGAKNKEAAAQWKALSSEERGKWRRMEHMENAQIKKQQLAEMTQEMVDCSSWDEMDEELVMFLQPPGTKVKVEQQRARVLRASGGNVLLAQHCFECQTIFCPRGAHLFCCPLCKKSLNQVKFDNDHKLFRVTPRPCLDMELPGTEENAEALHAEGPEVVLPKQLNDHIKKWERRGYKFTDAAKTMLRLAVEQFASLRFMRGHLSQQHRKSATLKLEDLRFGSLLSDTDFMSNMLQMHQAEAQRLVFGQNCTGTLVPQTPKLEP